MNHLIPEGDLGAFSPDPLGNMRLFAGGGSQPSETTTISKSEPPEYVQPYSIEMMERAGALSDAPYQSYQGQRVADFTDQQLAGLQMTQDRAMYGSPMTNTAQEMGVNTMAGDYFGPGTQENPMYGQNNPYLNQTIENAQADITDNYQDVIMPQMAAQERMSGAFGNSGAQQMAGKAQESYMDSLGDVSNQMRMQDYAMQMQLGESQLGRQQQAFDSERANQMRAMSMSPQFAEQDYADAQRLLGVGDVLRDYNQTQLNLGEQDWMSAQQWPYQQLDTLANAVRTSMGGGGTMVSSSPNAYQPNQTANMLGGGMMGYGIGQQFDQPMMGAAAGGLLGLWG